MPDPYLWNKKNILEALPYFEKAAQLGDSESAHYYYYLRGMAGVLRKNMMKRLKIFLWRSNSILTML